MRGAPMSLVGVPNTINGNKTFTGLTTVNNQLVVNGETGSFVTLKLAAASGQTGNLLELYNTSAVRVAYFDQSGNFISSGASSYASTQVVQGTTGLGFSVKGNASNSSDLQQWQSSTGAVLLGITEAGALYGTAGLSVGGNLVLTGATGLQIRDDNSVVDPGVPWVHSDGSNLILNPHGSGNVYLSWDVKGKTFCGGSLLAAGAVSLNIPTTSGDWPNPFTSSASLYVNTASSGATGGRVSFSSNGPAGNDGAYIEYVPASAGNTANRLHITSNGATALTELDLDAAITTHAGQVAIYNSSELKFYTDAGLTLKGYLGEYTSSGDMTLASKSSGTWLRVGANGGPIAFWTDGNTDVNTSPQVQITGSQLRVGTIGTTSVSSLGVQIAAAGAAQQLSFENTNSPGNVWKLWAGDVGIGGANDMFLSRWRSGSTSGIAGGAEECLLRFTDDGTNRISYFTAPNGTVLFAIRNDSSVGSPGVPWIRPAGASIVLSAASGGQVYLGWDNASTVNVGADLVAVGAVKGHNGFQCVETGSGSPLHAEAYGAQGLSGGVGPYASVAITLNFARAYAAAPAASGSCNTSAGNSDAYVGRSNVSGTAATLFFTNNDGNAQTLSSFSIMAIG